MANTGYKINPQVIQIFTTGPNSGSIVTSSFTVTFDSGSGFNSASLCNQFFYNKEYDPYNCIIPSFCVPPILYTAYSQYCDSSYNYTYQFAIGAGSSSLEGLRVEYSLTPDFTGEVKGTTITDYIGSTIAPLNVNISNGLTNRSEISSSGLVTLPLNQYSPVYFRAKSICSGSNSSSYSNIQEGKCIAPPSSYYHRFSPGVSTSVEACSAVSYPVVYFNNNPTLLNGAQLWNDGGQTIKANGSNLIYKSQELNQSVRIDTLGKITILTSC